MSWVTCSAPGPSCGRWRPTWRACWASWACPGWVSIPGLTAVGAAAILAETGDPRRYDSSSSLVKHAGLAPADNASGALSGQAHISRRGRPGLRLAVWRAVWPMLRFNPVMAAKYAGADPGRRRCRAGGRRVRRYRDAAGHRGGCRGQGAARDRPGRVRRLPAALDLLHGHPRHQLGSRRSRPATASTPSVSSRRQPDQRFARTARVPPELSPRGGDSEPAATLRISLAANPGQLSPGRPDLLTSPVERCRGRPSRAVRLGRARLHYVAREDPGDGHPQPRRARLLSGAGPQHALSQIPAPASHPGQRAPHQP